MLVGPSGIMQSRKSAKQSGVSRLDLESGGDAIAIEHGGRLYPVGSIPVTLGRSPTADIVIDHSAVSRHHARIFRGKAGFEVEDLKSRNGVRVDAHRVQGRAAIYPGVVITLGDVSVVVREARRSSLAPLAAGASFTRALLDEDTSPVDGLLLFMTAVDEALIKGATRDAERAFAQHLGRPAERAAQRGKLDPGVAQTVALLSLRVGEATSSSVWLDFVVRLYSETASVIPLTVINAMQALARKLGGVDRGALRQYTAHFEGRLDQLTQEERCSLDRLAALAASSFGDLRPRAAG
jgi:pSer/pThr/pTyr-binding forkhead associated (FHA) protein